MAWMPFGTKHHFEAMEESKGFSGPGLVRMGENPGSRNFWSDGDKNVLDRISSIARSLNAVKNCGR
jgi:hypothetical protein